MGLDRSGLRIGVGVCNRGGGQSLTMGLVEAYVRVTADDDEGTGRLIHDGLGDPADYPQVWTITGDDDPNMDHFNDWALTIEAIEALDPDSLFHDTGPE